jgi:predicted transport protein
MYYDWVISNLDWIKNAYKSRCDKKKIKIEDENPRIILVAKNFPDKVTTLAKYFDEYISRVDLYSYKAVLIDNKKEIICNEYQLPNVPLISEKPKTPDEILTRIKDDNVRKECQKIRDYIMNLDPDIEESPTRKNITFKYKNRNICEIKPRVNSFVFGWRNTNNIWVKERGITEFEKVKEIIHEKENVIDFYKSLKS